MMVNGHIQHEPLTPTSAKKLLAATTNAHPKAVAAETVELSAELGFFVNGMDLTEKESAGKYRVRATMMGGQSSTAPCPHRAPSSTPVSLVQYVRVEPGSHDVTLRAHMSLGVYGAAAISSTTAAAKTVAIDAYSHSLNGAVVTVVLIPDQTDPIDCKLAAEWTPYGQCSKSCGEGGVVVSTRPITHGAKSGGKKCPPRAHLTRAKSCFVSACPTHCELSGWSDFASCTRSCGGGTSKRTRSAVVAARHGGNSCGAVGATSHVRQCNTHLCPIDCELSSSGWSACSKTCGQVISVVYTHAIRTLHALPILVGQGVAAEKRVVVAQPKFGGKACPAAKDLTQIKICEARTCQVS
jgi:hypothetical protein